MANSDLSHRFSKAMALGYEHPATSNILHLLKSAGKQKRNDQNGGGESSPSSLHTRRTSRCCCSPGATVQASLAASEPMGGTVDGRNPTHHRSEFRSPGMIRFPGKCQPTMASAMVSKRCAMDSVHPPYLGYAVHGESLPPIQFGDGIVSKLGGQASTCPHQTVLPTALKSRVSRYT